MRENLVQESRGGAARAQTGPPEEMATGGRDLRPRLVGAIRPVAADLGQGGRRLALALIACIVALGILGIVHDASDRLPAFDLDAEIDFHGLLPVPNVAPAVFSGLLLFVAAAMALVAAARREKGPWLALALLFAFMAVDELAAIHERVDEWLGIPWLIPYAPLIFAAGIFWFAALIELWPAVSERSLWLGGALAWLAAQGLEAIWIAIGSDTGPTSELSVPEELLEMAGSSMLLLALYVLLFRRRARQPG
jgi:hypothetical protein